LKVRKACVSLTKEEWNSLDHKEMVRTGFRDKFNGHRDVFESPYLLFPKGISPQELADGLRKFLKRESS